MMVSLNDYTVHSISSITLNDLFNLSRPEPRRSRHSSGFALASTKHVESISLMPFVLQVLKIAHRIMEAQDIEKLVQPSICSRKVNEPLGITIHSAAFQPSSMENACHVFSEFEPEQPATAVVNFINKVLFANRRS
ncbi:hypothetical protein GCK32_022874 [Trichostrongylus colubriformis]|uniref:Uncharacterized protein n=1 Tax=Trichostrongylus colubriformis TaxID=6319 RepID=A0AAN8F018_TRICO